MEARTAAQTVRGCLSAFIGTGILLFWGFGLFGAISEGQSLGDVIPGLLVLTIIPIVIFRRLRGRRR